MNQLDKHNNLKDQQFLNITKNQNLKWRNPTQHTMLFTPRNSSSYQLGGSELCRLSIVVVESSPHWYRGLWWPCLYTTLIISAGWLHSLVHTLVDSSLDVGGEKMKSSYLKRDQDQLKEGGCNVNAKFIDYVMRKVISYMYRVSYMYILMNKSFQKYHLRTWY